MISDASRFQHDQRCPGTIHAIPPAYRVQILSRLDTLYYGTGWYRRSRFLFKRSSIRQNGSELYQDHFSYLFDE